MLIKLFKINVSPTDKTQQCLCRLLCYKTRGCRAAIPGNHTLNLIALSRVLVEP